MSSASDTPISNTPAETPATAHARLEHLPVTLFGMTMGMGGLALGYIQGQKLLSFAAWLPQVFIWLFFTLLATLMASYGLKLLRHLPAVRSELLHPVRMHFFPLMSISLLLASLVTKHMGVDNLSLALWVAGASAHVALTFYVIHRWLNHDFQITHINPAWFIPVVGNIIIPIAGVQHGFVELSWFFFSIGMVFWLVLKAIVMYRLFFHSPMPERLMPTLFILIAPPAIGFLSYTSLTSEVDAFARVLFYFALFMTLMMALMLPRLMRLSFALSWWAYTFPLSGMVLALFSMNSFTGIGLFSLLGAVLLALLTALVTHLLYLTIRAARAGKICVPE